MCIICLCLCLFLFGLKIYNIPGLLCFKKCWQVNHRKIQIKLVWTTKIYPHNCKLKCQCNIFFWKKKVWCIWNQNINWLWSSKGWCLTRSLFWPVGLWWFSCGSSCKVRWQYLKGVCHLSLYSGVVSCLILFPWGLSANKVSEHTTLFCNL